MQDIFDLAGFIFTRLAGFYSLCAAASMDVLQADTVMMVTDPGHAQDRSSVYVCVESRKC